MTRPRLARTFALGLALALGAPHARAAPPQRVPLDEGTRSAARALGDEGFARYQAGDAAGALERFERAHALVRLPTTGLWVARCLAALGRLVEADNRYADVARTPLEPGMPEVHARAQRDALAEREALAGRIPRLVVVIEGSGAQGARPTLDGKALPAALLGAPIPVDPGAHVFRVEGGARMEERRATLSEGATVRITLTLDAPRPVAPVAIVLEPSPPRPAPVLRTAGLVATGVGAAVAIAGGVLGAVAIAQRSSLAEACPGGRCPPAHHDDADALDRWRTLSTAGIAAGAGLAAAGVVMLLLAPGPSAPLRAGGCAIAF